MQDYFSYPTINGYKILGLFQENYPNFKILTAPEFSLRGTTKNWVKIIEACLQQYDKVLYICNDMDMLTMYDHEKRDILNSFCNEEFYLVTELDSFSQKHYGYQIGLTCKILELPWMLCNECLCYYFVKDNLTSCDTDSWQERNFVNLNGRTEWYRLEIAKALYDRNLHTIGDIFFQEPSSETILYNFKTTPIVNYNKKSEHKKIIQSNSEHDEDACTKNIFPLGNKLVSMNTENFLELERFCQNIPLIIHTESTPGTFPTTEKTMWPILLGKLQLILAKPHHYSHLKKFINTDYDEIFDMSFDSIEAYDEKAYLEKINCMIDDNIYQIKHSFEIHKAYADSLNQDRDALVKNLFEFCMNQLQNLDSGKI